ncbi:MAG: hypothetical protein GY701_29785 [Sulfitobacter sp.]|nr:hypothetical protein [Sulfitobacter sp.]
MLGRSDMVVSRVLLTADERTLGSELWAMRQTHLAWAAGSLVFLLAAITATWSKRSETALYRILGLNRSEVMAVRVVDSSLAALLGTLAGSVFAVLMLSPNYRESLGYGLKAACLGLAGQLAGCLVASLLCYTTNAFGALKDR